MTPQQALVAAVLAGDLEAARRALSLGADPDTVVDSTRGEPRSTVPNGFTALHVAAHHDDTALTELMIDRGADVMAKSRFGSTPLKLAVASNALGSAQALLKSGVAPDGAGALLVPAAGGGHVAMVELLLAHGARSGLDIALGCGFKGSVELLRVLIAAGARPVKAEPERWSARVVALDRRRFDCLELLSQSFEPETLIDAVIDGQLARVKQFLSAGAPVDVPLNHGITELACAARMGHREIALALLEAGAALDQKTLWGTPIFCAVLQEHLELAAEFFARGASLAELHGPLLNARCGVDGLRWVCERQPPANVDRMLCIAVTLKNVALVELFLSLGASADGEDAWGRKALALAALGNSVAVVRTLLTAGADAAIRDCYGQGLLHFLLTYDDYSEDWMDKNFDPARYDRGSPMLELEAVQLLLSAGARLPWDSAAI